MVTPSSPGRASKNRTDPGFAAWSASSFSWPGRGLPKRRSRHVRFGGVQGVGVGGGCAFERAGRDDRPAVGAVQFDAYVADAALGGTGDESTLRFDVHGQHVHVPGSCQRPQRTIAAGGERGGQPVAASLAKPAFDGPVANGPVVQIRQPLGAGRLAGRDHHRGRAVQDQPGVRLVRIRVFRFLFIMRNRGRPDSSETSRRPCSGPITRQDCPSAM